MNHANESPRRQISKRRSSLARLSSLSTLRALVNRLREGIYITNQNGQILDANPAFLKMLEVTSIEELGRIRAEDLYVNPRQREEELQTLAMKGEVHEYELQLRTPHGEVRTYLDTAYAVTDRSTRETLYHGILVDITAMKNLEAQLRDQATRDPLTGCFNRRFLAEVATEWNASDDTWGTAVLDIDHFKLYNDRYGHQVGDRALVKTARFLMRHIRAEDLVCRIGGDEFLVLLPASSDELTESIVARLKEEARQSAPVSFSIGWSVRKKRESLEKTIGRADEHLITVRVEERQKSRFGDGIHPVDEP